MKAQKGNKEGSKRNNNGDNVKVINKHVVCGEFEKPNQHSGIFREREQNTVA